MKQSCPKSHQIKPVFNGSDLSPTGKEKRDYHIDNEHIGVSGFNEISILPRSPNRVQPKLKVNPANDKYEQEADRIAEHVMRTPDESGGCSISKKSNLGIKNRSPHSLLQRKCIRCEDEDLIQTKSIGNIKSSPSPGFVNQVQKSRGKGKSMDGNISTFMESRVGADFSNVKIHTDDTAVKMSREINADAFTYKQNIYFNQNKYKPNTIEGKKLLAHELTHTIQQSGNSSDSIQRAPGKTAKKEEKDLCVVQHRITASTLVDLSEKKCQKVKDGMQVELPKTVYQGDTFMVEVNNLLGTPLDWKLPPDLEFVEYVTGTKAQLRVVGIPPEEGAIRKLSFKILTNHGQPDINVIVKQGHLDQTVDATNPEILQSKKDRKALKAERKAKKKAHKKAKKELKKEHKSLDRSERKEHKDEYKRKKSDLKKKRKVEKKELNKSRQELRKKKQAINSGSSCGLGSQKMITTALNKAVNVATAGVAKLQNGTANKDVAANLKSIIKWPVQSKSKAENSKMSQKVADVINVAKNNMLLSKHSEFVCGSIHCDENTGAFVDGGSGRGGAVTVCTNWLRKGVRFGFAGKPEEHQAFALLHEFVHLAGPIGNNETYVHKTSEWKKISHQKALKMADAYARIAWNLGG